MGSMSFHIPHESSHRADEDSGLKGPVTPRRASLPRCPLGRLYLYRKEACVLQCSSHYFYRLLYVLLTVRYGDEAGFIRAGSEVDAAF